MAYIPDATGDDLTQTIQTMEGSLINKSEIKYIKGKTALFGLLQGSILKGVRMKKTLHVLE